MIVTVHQPEHLPWLGFFDKLRQADLWVMLDHVQYNKRNYQNRNRCRGANGPLWITAPVQVKGKYYQQINEVQIDNDGNPQWRKNCWESLVHSYGKASFFTPHSSFFENLYRQDWESLVDLNEEIIRYLLSAIGIEVGIVKSSSLEITSRKGDLILEICDKLGASTYLSGTSGGDYLDASRFEEHGIELAFQEFHHPIYRQLHEPFEPCMSAIDLLFNYGPESLNVIKGIGVETLDHVFN